MSSVLERGHKKVAIVTLPQEAFAKDDEKKSRSIEKRKEGYQRALRKFHLSWEDTISEYKAEVSYNAGVEIANLIIDSQNRPTAIVTMSDIVAIGIIQGLKCADIKPGEDISIVGFDGIDEGNLTDPPLATISQPGEQKGKMAASLLFQTLNKEEVNSNILMPCKFITRSSLGSYLKDEY